MLRRTCTSSLALRFAAGAPPPPPSSRGALLRHQRALAAAAWPSDEPLPAKLGPVNSPDIEQMLKRLPAGTHLGQHVMQEATNDTGRVGNCPYLSSHPVRSAVLCFCRCAGCVRLRRHCAPSLYLRVPHPRQNSKKKKTQEKQKRKEKSWKPHVRPDAR